MSLWHYAGTGSQAHLCGTLCYHLVASLQAAQYLDTFAIGGACLYLYAAIYVVPRLHIYKEKALCLGYRCRRYGQHTAARRTEQIYFSKATCHNVATVVKLEDDGHKEVVGVRGFSLRHQSATQLAD